MFQNVPWRCIGRAKADLRVAILVQIGYPESLRSVKGVSRPSGANFGVMKGLLEMLL